MFQSTLFSRYAFARSDGNVSIKLSVLHKGPTSAQRAAEITNMIWAKRKNVQFLELGDVQTSEFGEFAGCPLLYEESLFGR